MSDAPLLVCRDLVIGHGGRPLLPAFSFAIAPGEVVLVVGGNGAGKSTWLKTILGLIPPVGGSVEVAPGTRFAYVPQEPEIDPLIPLTARDIASWGRLRGWGFLDPLRLRRERGAINRALVTAGAQHFAEEPFAELSGGQKQRALFARMLASDANLALLDEPTAAMDMTAEREAYEQLTRLARRRRLALIVVTHTLNVASRYADKAIFFDRGTRAGGAAVHAGELGEVFARPEFRDKFGDIPVATGAGA
jgi:zinc transport system ATP-binding protein